MRRFASLYRELDDTTKTSVKVAAMRDYFATAPPDDAAWAVHVLSGRRLKRLVGPRKLGAWASVVAGIEDWLFEESYDAVGDLAETIALLLPGEGADDETPLHAWIEDVLVPLRDATEEAQREAIVGAWSVLTPFERFVFNKLLTGSLRVGVSARLVTRALAEAAELPAAVVAHRLMGAWTPSADAYLSLLAPDSGESADSQPYPFLLAHATEDPQGLPGALADWLAEWKWDGIRAQLIRRSGEVWIWSRGEELITDGFPELADASAALPDGTVLDGEVVAWADDRVLPFSALQRRINRKTPSRKILAEVPAILICFDLLEADGLDIREQPLSTRRSLLLTLLAGCEAPALRPSEAVPAESWDGLTARRDEARAQGVEGLMLKRLDAGYGVGRPRGPWWKWKVDPYTVDAVLIYAQRGRGRRASLYTDYTFGVWDGDELVSFAKAYSGLSDEEIAEVDRFVRRNIIDRFGPVRAVTPELVFELAFERLAPSKRHKSGIAVRFPRIVRWRKDRSADEADRLETVRGLMKEAE